MLPFFKSLIGMGLKDLIIGKRFLSRLRIPQNHRSASHAIDDVLTTVRAKPELKRCGDIICRNLVALFAEFSHKGLPGIAITTLYLI
jgi:hypothetical protein